MTTSNLKERNGKEWKRTTWRGEWMRVTLTKHRGHGMKPLSHENKEFLSSFVRRYPYLRLPTILFPFRLLSLPPFSFTYFYLCLFATVRIITPSLSLSAGHHLRRPYITLIDLLLREQSLETDRINKLLKQTASHVITIYNKISI